MPPPRDDQYISLSPTNSPGDDREANLSAPAPGRASHSGCQQVGKGLTRIADTPPTPQPKNVDFQHFVTDYELNFRVILLVEGASTQVPGLWLGTLVLNSAPRHHWSTRSRGR